MKLRITSPQGERSIALDPTGNPMVAGRGKNVPIYLQNEDRTLSREHVAFRVKGSTVEITVLSDKLGVLTSRGLIPPSGRSDLMHGDTLSLGEHTITVESSPAQPHNHMPAFSGVFQMPAAATPTASSFSNSAPSSNESAFNIDQLIGGDSGPASDIGKAFIDNIANAAPPSHPHLPPLPPLTVEIPSELPGSIFPSTPTRPATASPFTPPDSIDSILSQIQPTLPSSTTGRDPLFGKQPVQPPSPIHSDTVTPSFFSPQPPIQKPTYPAQVDDDPISAILSKIQTGSAANPPSPEIPSPSVTPVSDTGIDSFIPAAIIPPLEVAQPTPAVSSPSTESRAPTAQTSAPKAAASNPSMDVAAFAKGLGIPVPDPITPEDWTRIGSMLRQHVDAINQLMKDRAALKNELRAFDKTQLYLSENNPYKTNMSLDSLLQQLIWGNSKQSGLMPVDPAVREATNDLRAHNLAIIAASRACVEGTIGEFSPDQLKRHLETTRAAKVVAFMEYGQLWRSYQDYYKDKSTHMADWLEAMFEKHFVVAYSRETHRLSQQTYRVMRNDGGGT